MPLYWMHETTGRMRKIVQKYFLNEPMTKSEFRVLKAYVLQWTEKPMLVPTEYIRMLNRAETVAELRETCEILLKHGIEPF